MVANAQEVVHIGALKPIAKEPVIVQKINEDSLSSTFVIWIQKEVAAHYHAQHHEQIYVLEGEADFTLGTKMIKLKAGDFVAIPKNTVHAVHVTSPGPLKVISIQTPRFDGSDRIWVKKE